MTVQVTPYRLTTARYAVGVVRALVSGGRHRPVTGRHARRPRVSRLELALHYVAAFRYVRESALSWGVRLPALAATTGLALLVAL